MLHAQQTTDTAKKETEIEQVVLIGYGKQKKEDLTGSISSITSKDFNGGSTSADQLIQGKAPGVTVTGNGGNPGSGSTIRIRGGASLTASNDPLIVIDGIPMDFQGLSGASNALALINPN
ncbi:MAG: TonB-dependent receptor plug domain-containing protein, partial [Chryseobacterium sp.]|nr:TonB-dependent receptor plug domain-containing protein [Chryseobacterium sp.]